MRVKIGTRVYDTDTSTKLGHQSVGVFGQLDGFEETLYRKTTGEYFLECKGGPESQYPVTELVPLSDSDAKEWAERVLGEEEAGKILKAKKKSAKKSSKKQ